MAVPKWPGTSQFGPFAVDDLARLSTAALYIYAIGVSEAEMAQLIGWRNKTGALVDGVFTNLLQAFTGTATEGLVEDFSTAVIEIDSDTSSPYFGYIRLKIVLTPPTDT